MTTYITEAEKQEFRAALKRITMLKPTEQQPRQSPQTEKIFLFPDFALNGVIPLLEPQDAVVYRANGVQERALKKMLPEYIEDELDLHGCILKQACDQLRLFLLNALRMNYRLLRVIHGKGKHGEKPILKSRVVYWLQQVPQVLALRSARPQDGGTGSLYVLLTLETL